MQNLQIRYGEFSAQLEYLEQYDLVQEEEIHRHEMSDFGEIDEDGLEFAEMNVEESKEDQRVSLTKFVENITMFKQEGEKNMFHRVMKVVFGDIMEYEYEHNYRIALSPTAFFVRQKWSIICHLFFLIALITYLRLECILLIATALWFLTVEQSEDSQLQIEESFKPGLSNLSSQIKCIYLDKAIYSSRAIGRLTNDLETIVRHLKTRYCLDLTDSPFIIDQLNESFHLLLQAAASRSFSKKYLQSQSILKKKYFYWRLKLENRKLSKLIDVVTAILSNFSQNKWGQPAKHTKPKPVESVYFRLLMAKIQKQYHSIQKGKTFHQLYRQMISLLIKEVEFKRVLRFHQQRISPTQEQNIEKSFQQVPIFHQEQRLVFNAYYVEDDNPIPYEPQNTESIKQKLNQLFIKKQAKSQQSSSQESPKESTLQKVVQKPERSIFSFGIPYAPPTRDLSAFYYQ